MRTPKAGQIVKHWPTGKTGVVKSTCNARTGLRVTLALDDGSLLHTYAKEIDRVPVAA